MSKRVFGELELAILQLFKGKKSGYTVKEILPLLGKEDKYTTVMTVMSRLASKGELSREKEGLAYRYFSKEKKMHFTLLEKWKKKLFGGKTAPMISYLLGSSEKLSSEEILEIENLIKEAKKRK
jgi:predicted transcriptional regulator